MAIRPQYTAAISKLDANTLIQIAANSPSNPMLKHNAIDPRHQTEHRKKILSLTNHGHQEHYSKANLLSRLTIT